MDNCTCPPGCCSGNRWFKPAVIILGILIVLGLFSNIYLFLRKEKQNPLIPKITPIPTQATILATPTPDPTANWKTYQGKPPYSTAVAPVFSVKYPLEWEIEEYVLYPLGKNSDKGLETRLYLGYVGRSIPPPQKKKVFPAGVMDYYWKDNGQQIFAYAILTKNNNTYSFVLENLPSIYGKQYEGIFDQILSTFRFLD